MVRARALAASCILLGCEPKLIVGERMISEGGTAGTLDAGGAGATPPDAGESDAGTGGNAGAAGDIGDAGAGGNLGDAGAGGAGPQCPDGGDIPGQTDPIAVPWSTSFENGFCDFVKAGGFCLGGGTRRTVTTPVPKSGMFAAEFSVVTTDTMNIQARCVLQGALPNEAYYSAWYYVPALATLDSTSSLFNLFHFRGGDASPDGLWDVTLVNSSNGDLELLVYDFLAPRVRKQTNPRPIPIGRWFHIQFYLKRASDATGAIALYQDDELLVEASGIVTDNSSWAQWYVGNIAKGLTPPVSTVYVDQVTITKTRN